MARNFICTADYPVVDTQWGKLKGFVLDGIFTFQGIQYAKAKRFHMPEDLEPWDGIKEATNYGCISPTMGNPIPAGEIRIPHRYWPENETCQFLNVWTKSIDKDAKKPVVVWYHGGGYSDGSSLEQVAYEGDALADYGDVVVVTVNHRLNILGFLDLSSYGEEYWNSGNAGMADILASLKWIHNNIASFGGDPENVTIFGQSGGGGKVCTLLQCPDAAGLFHKAIMMSGGAGMMKMGDDVNHKVVVDAMLEVLGFDSVKQLEKIPYSLLTKAYNKACRKTGKMLGWSPKANGWYLGHPLEAGFSSYAKKVPTIVSSVIAEFSAMGGNRDLAEAFQGHQDEVVAEFNKVYPGKAMSPAQLSNRSGITDFLDARAASDPETPGYSYLLSLVFSVDGGVPAWHCSDIPFIFHNANRVACCNMGDVTDKIESDMAGALVAFAYTGNPNHEGMTEWKPYTKDEKATMVFDENTECRVDYDTKLNKLLTDYSAPFHFSFAIPSDDEEEEGRAWLY